MIAIGALAGALAGVVAWAQSRRCICHYRDRPAPTLRGLASAAGAAPLGPALAMGGLALLGAWAGWRDVAPLALVSALIVTAILGAISAIDLHVRRIPDALSLALGVWGLAVSAWEGRAAAALLGLAVGLGIFTVIALVGRGAMGAGDVKLAAALGAVLGYPPILQGLFWGIIAGGIGALVLLVSRRAGRKDTMAYGPYLALGGWLVHLGALGLLF